MAPTPNTFTCFVSLSVLRDSLWHPGLSGDPVWLEGVVLCFLYEASLFALCIYNRQCLVLWWRSPGHPVLLLSTEGCTM